MSSSIARTEIVDGWSLGFAADSAEPLFRDLDLAERAGLTDPHAIRRTIEKAINDGEISIPAADRKPESSCFAVVVTERVPLGQGRFREVDSYHLDEEAALEILMRLRTKEAKALRRDVRRVYLAWRRGELASRVPIAALDTTTVNSARVRDNEQALRDLRFAVHVVATIRGYSKQRIIGWIRKNWSVSSPFAISTHLVPEVKRALESLARGETSLGSKREARLLEKSKRQRSFDWGAN